MCIAFSTKPQRLIAPKEGVICYKELHRNDTDTAWRSKFFPNHEYVDGQKNPTVKIKLFYIRWSKKWYGERGYHSYVNQPIDTINNGVIVQCLIPARAVYYKGQYKCRDGTVVANYISSRIVITGNLRTGKVKMTAWKMVPTVPDVEMYNAALDVPSDYFEARYKAAIAAATPFVVTDDFLLRVNTAVLEADPYAFDGDVRLATIRAIIKAAIKEAGRE